MDDYIVDEDFLVPRKKKINSGDKGKRGERETAKILMERFKQSFSRSVGSGNRTKQVYLPKHAMDIFSGDLVTPENFNFTVENKSGYDDVDLTSILEDGHPTIDGFIKQASFDADKCYRKPLLVWKKARKPHVAGIRTTDLPHTDFLFRLIYKDWSFVNLKELLKAPDSFWFAPQQSS